ncbi:hypothetical protein MmTuc01_3139 [Methanosarcina mazei Tuc01]|uniref:Uncharacterized protein n=1 Tax=Methanosarcina mazei Tuc01 TaxID=1236903 RepID=M1Q1G0_METMZ|nr:hypothetical protein [Methanosarcina mazei]AGF98396.1 hypothetical protein MmTuc01_3139 [Methanosarcina mazei Tuc01]
MQVVAAQAGKGGPVQIRYAFDHVEYGILDALIPPAYKERIEKILASHQLTPTTIDLSSLSGLLNRPVSLIFLLWIL